MSKSTTLTQRMQQFVQLVLGVGAAGASHGSAMPPSPTDHPSSDLDGYTHAQSLNAGSQLIARGHRSHSSHSSHSSHYSSSGGSGYAAPIAPAYVPPTPAPSKPATSTAPASASSLAPAGSSSTSPSTYSVPGVDVPPPADLTAKGVRTPDALRMLVMRVQAALLLKNYDPGQVDGVMGAATVAALKKYQKATGLKVTGSINAQTLDALGLRSTF